MLQIKIEIIPIERFYNQILKSIFTRKKMALHKRIVI